MLTKKNIENTIYLSLAAQFITTIVSLDGIKYKLNDNDKILQDILKLELFVQVIESVFYIWIIYSLKRYDTMTTRRYIDWVITTPTMLISTIMFMKYQEHKENNDNVSLELYSFLNDNKDNIKKMVIYNGLMLLFGFLGETKKINKELSVGIGFIFFFLSFNLIYKEYANKSIEGKKLFNFLITVWSLYGFAALSDPITKNISYNILDVIAKNFYGLFIYFKIKNQRASYQDQLIQA
jgi:bacteriorhodopsin